ncbi:protein FAM136A-like [Amphiura filiformis]|uniref:protein FAM136A-like n=1 Tax=Amphiura filiformis TaxID=82378 RepID=UPI003B218FDB
MAEGLPAAVAACREKVDQGVTDMVTQLDKDVFRKMQIKMYQCSAKCCENQQSSMEAVQSCVQNCQRPVASAQEYMQKELEDFMERLQRCSLQCQDDVKDKLSPSTPSNEIEKIKSRLETCLVQCGERHTALLPGMTKRMKSNLAQFK